MHHPDVGEPAGLDDGPDLDDAVPIIFRSQEPADNYVGQRFVIRIFNLLGEIVEEFEKYPSSPDDTWMQWIPNNIATGIYIIHVQGPGVNIHKKVPIIR